MGNRPAEQLMKEGAKYPEGLEGKQQVLFE